MTQVTEKLVWDRFCRGVDFKRRIGLYDTVRTNENYFIGNQWQGVQAKGLPTPVFNFLKRVVLFQVATITSDNMTLQAAPLLPTAQFPPARLEEITGVLSTDSFRRCLNPPGCPPASGSCCEMQLWMETAACTFILTRKWRMDSR